MAKKDDTVAKRLKQWKADVRKWKEAGTWETHQRHITALSKAREYFGLDVRQEEDRLLYILADVVFGSGRPGRPQGSKKWSKIRLLQLANDRLEIKRDFSELKDSQAAPEIKQ